MKVYRVKATACGLGILLSVAAVAACYWALWMLWTAVFGIAWPTGPDAIVRPGFWLFAGEWALGLIVLKILVGAFRK